MTLARYTGKWCIALVFITIICADCVTSTFLPLLTLFIIFLPHTDPETILDTFLKHFTDLGDLYLQSEALVLNSCLFYKMFNSTLKSTYLNIKPLLNHILVILHYTSLIIMNYLILCNKRDCRKYYPIICNGFCINDLSFYPINNI